MNADFHVWSLNLKFRVQSPRPGRGVIRSPGCRGDTGAGCNRQSSSSLWHPFLVSFGPNLSYILLGFRIGRYPLRFAYFRWSFGVKILRILYEVIFNSNFREHPSETRHPLASFNMLGVGKKKENDGKGILKDVHKGCLMMHCAIMWLWKKGDIDVILECDSESLMVTCA